MSNFGIALLISYLFALAIGGHTRDSYNIRGLGLSEELNEQANTNETERWYPVRFMTKKYTHQWSVPKSIIRQKATGMATYSSLFPGTTNDEYVWAIALFSKGVNKLNREHISIYFELRPSDQKNFDWARYKFSILDENGNHLYERDSERPELSNSKSRWGFDDYISRDILSDPKEALLPGGNLRILCEIDLYVKIVEYSEQPDRLEAPRDQLANNLEQLYERPMFTDLTISVGEEQFIAHKAILAARSPVFKAMFGHNMRESQVNRLEVIDIEPVVFQEVLRYIYTGKSTLLESKELTVDDSQDHQEAQQQLVVGLLMASDKYQLDGLGSICEQVLTRAISLDSADEILLLADTFNRPQLKNRVVEFMRDNHDELNEADNSMATFMDFPPEPIALINQ